VEARVHELSVTQSVVEAVIERTGDAPVATVRVRVGRLSGVVADAMLFCFDLVTSGTALEGATLEIETCDAVASCRSCRHRFVVDDAVLLCPCGSADVEILSGRELTVASVVMV
jgi:hydrogenase nickel incorporation protein HypA/HybF